MTKKVEISPQNERLLVESIVVANVTEGGIVLTSDGEDKIETTYATIIAASDDLKDKHKAGEVVFHSPRAGIGIALRGKKYLLLTDAEVLAKLVVSKEELGSAIGASKENLL